MRPFYLVILIVAQVWIAFQIALEPVNLAKVDYRRQERTAAFDALHENPSPATEAAVKEELIRAGNHVRLRQFTSAGVIFAAFVVLDVFGLYLYRRTHVNNKQTRNTGP